MVVRSVAKADVAELSAALDSAVDQEKEHHLIIVGTNKVLSTTQFKQMFYSRGDDFFQIANVYECPDNCESVHSSVWGIDCKDPHVGGTSSNAVGLVTMDGNRLTGVPGEANPAASILNRGVGYSSGTANANLDCFNFNKLGGRENDPKGCAWAYSYAHDADRNFYAQHEVMGYLEKDTCVKRDFWTACSRMSIEDQLYGLAFASETDQDLCMAVTCARRWSEVEDALAESCTAANEEISTRKHVYTFSPITVSNNSATGEKLVIKQPNLSGSEIFHFEFGAGTFNTVALQVAAINSGAAGGHTLTLASGFTAVASFVSNTTLKIVLTAGGGSGTALPTSAVLDGTASTAADATNVWATINIVGAGDDNAGETVDLFINVRVSNGHPKALDTILRVRFTVGYVRHEPSALHYWNTRASTAASGVINSGVVGDAPEGGKKQHEDTTVVST